MVHAPHWAVSQPMCVPVSPNSSRRNWTSRIWGSTVAVTALPLTVRLMLSAMLLSPSRDKQPNLTHRFCFTGLADFTTVSVWLGSWLLVVTMSKAQSEDGRYWAKGGWGGLKPENRPVETFPECHLHFVLLDAEGLGRNR